MPASTGRTNAAQPYNRHNITLYTLDSVSFLYTRSLPRSLYCAGGYVHTPHRLSNLPLPALSRGELSRPNSLRTPQRFSNYQLFLLFIQVLEPKTSFPASHIFTLLPSWTQPLASANLQSTVLTATPIYWPDYCYGIVVAVEGGAEKTR